MATSGTRTFALDVDEAILEAFELAGLEYRTGYDARAARRSMNVMFADWSNRGVQMWEVEEVSLDLVEGTTSYTLNAFDIDILDAVIRRTVGSTQTDFEIDRIDRNEYLNIPTKNTKARPTQFYFEKTTTPKLYLWPAPENSTDKFISYRWKRIQDVTGATEDIDIPSRFMPCLTSGLAFYLAMKRNPDKVQILQPMYEQNLLNALRYDEDRTSVHIVPRRTYM
jgi:hypothetical protein|tara:strand:- start:386 stop:1057 length:672 start_codon:yes stop_codon:yes gene_type:complete